MAGLAGALGDWLDAAGLERPVLVANSFGCQVAVELAAAGAAVDGFVLVGPTVDRTTRTWAGQALRRLADGPLEPPSLGLVIARDYVDCGLRRPLRPFAAALQQLTEDRMPAIAAPVLVVRGVRDPIAPRRWCRELAEAAMSARLVEIPRSAHTANYSHAQALADIILRQLRATR